MDDLGTYLAISFLGLPALFLLLLVVALAILTHKVDR